MPYHRERLSSLEDWLQKKIEEQGRSTVHSFISLAYNAYGIVFCSALAVIMPELRASRILIGLSLYIILISLAMGAVYRMYARKDAQRQ
ncbi:MAG TPA: hypothetical protein PK369_09900 [Thermoclostridium sp.]|nr:hypothetical protein [Clostridiaceae bacterium]HOQ76863.1 hypothetical protein [Thermoclostridium sp.]HPU45985.1 hypothetical protein [Thermoclostridium sp.]